ncbi:hypothetical protein HNY73_005639 [Argiope bruennichi]|uniref:ATP-dependent DNA helicase n=1 Tax=Argiope bruennichi TaxID=94029 RepID=A0A8T0FI21_ARGBR|nr:hypothetical protein HNY73_005639 [Argiope bruennichi]
MQKLTGNYLKVMREQWQDIEFLFIDEISMVPYEMLCMIDNRLQQFKTVNVLFSGINLIVFGDLMQLPPIRGSQVFNQPQYMAPAIHLWQLFTRNVTAISRIKAQDQLVDAARTRNIEALDMSKIIPTDMNKTGGLPAELEIFVGAKVMLRSNIDVKKSLVNGAIGFITEIHWLDFRGTQMYRHSSYCEFWQ